MCRDWFSIFCVWLITCIFWCSHSRVKFSVCCSSCWFSWGIEMCMALLRFLTWISSPLQRLMLRLPTLVWCLEKIKYSINLCQNQPCSQGLLCFQNDGMDKETPWTTLPKYSMIFLVFWQPWPGISQLAPPFWKWRCPSGQGWTRLDKVGWKLKTTVNYYLPPPFRARNLWKPTSPLKPPLLSPPPLSPFLATKTINNRIYSPFHSQSQLWRHIV